MGFFFQGKDLGEFINNVVDNDAKFNRQMSELEDAVPDHILVQITESANFHLHHVPKNYSQELDFFSHGEAYLQIMHDKINQRGICCSMNYRR